MNRIKHQFEKISKQSLVIGLTLSIATTQPLTVFATGDAGASLESKVGNGIIRVETGSCTAPSTTPTTGSTSGAPVGSSATVPKEAVKLFESAKKRIDANKAVYEKAGQEQKVPWSIIAALHYREAKNDPTKSVLSGEPIGTPNPDNPITTRSFEHSAIEAAKHVKRMAKGVYGVDIKADGSHSLEELQQIFVAYNRGYMYKTANASPDTSPYAMNYYDDKHINMRWPNGPQEPGVTRGNLDTGNLGAVTVYTLLGGAASGSCAGSFTDAYVNPDGYAFPVGLPKVDASNGWNRFNGKTAPDPYCARASCHHDGTASFDIAHRLTVTGGTGEDDRTTGRPVFAITDGKIASVKDGYAGQNGCHSIQLYAKDGFYYWYGHIAKTKVKKGQEVKAGEQITEVGERRCTGNGSYPHLHIDRGTCGTIRGEKGLTRCARNAAWGGSVGSRDPGFTDTMNRIYKLWPLQASSPEDL